MLFVPLDKLEKARPFEVPIKDCVTQMETKLITGTEPLENFDEYIKHLNQLERKYTKRFTSTLTTPIRTNKFEPVRNRYI